MVPRLIVGASKFFVAWMFRHFSDPTGAEAFWVEAQRLLDAHVDAESILSSKKWGLLVSQAFC